MSMNNSFNLFNSTQLEEENYKGYPNPSKIVKIHLTKGDDAIGNTEKNHWRQNLYRIFSSGEFNATDFQNLSVDRDIELTFDKFPEISCGSDSWGTLSSSLSSILDSMGPLGSKVNKLLSSDKTSSLINIVADASNASKSSGTAAASAFNPWFMQVPTWNPTDACDALTFDLEFEFRMGQYGKWNAFEEVYKPAINLIAPCMLRKNGLITTTGPAPSLVTLMIGALKKIDLFGSNSASTVTTEGASQGEGTTESTSDDIGEQVTDDLLGQISKGISDAIQSAYNGYIYTIEIGHFATFPNVFLTNATLTWGTEVDNYGYPTYSKVKLTAKTLTPPAITNVNSMAQAIRFGGN